MVPGVPVRRIVRLEVELAGMVEQHDRASSLLAAFAERLEKLAPRVAAFKSIAAYRTGLDIGRPAPGEVEYAFSAVRRAVVPGRPPRLAAKPLIDAMLWAVLPVAAATRTPVQFHTGFGDPDLDLRLANPLHLRPLFEAAALRGLRVVCLHCYPYVREAGYLASVYPGAYVDLGLTVPYASVHAMRTSLHEAMHLAPITKVLLSTDAQRTPETFWLAARWGRRVLGQVLEAPRPTATCRPTRRSGRPRASSSTTPPSCTAAARRAEHRVGAVATMAGRLLECAVRAGAVTGRRRGTSNLSKSLPTTSAALPELASRPPRRDNRATPPGFARRLRSRHRATPWDDQHREGPMDLELRGRTAVVTGCSVGIGREIARVLAAEGVPTLVVARRGDLLKTLQDEIEAAGWVRPHALAVDLADRAAPARVRDEALARLGHVDILVNNAGGSRPTAVDAADGVWDESFAINFTAVRKLTQALLPGMIERRWGRIINVTGTSEPAGTNAAGPAKAAVHAWAKGLSRDVGRHGITVNCLAPGRIHSEQIDQRLHPTPENQEQFSRQIPLGYFGDPSDMAYLVAFLCSPKARYITGERIHVDGGLRRAY